MLFQIISSTTTPSFVCVIVRERQGFEEEWEVYEENGCCVRL